MPRLLTNSITNLSSNIVYSVTWDISVNNIDISGNFTTSNIKPFLANPARIDVSYNFSVSSLASNETTRSTYIPNPYNGQLCYLTDSSINTLFYYNSAIPQWLPLTTAFPIGTNLFSILSTSGSNFIPRPIFLNSSKTTGSYGVEGLPYPVSGGYTVYKFTITSNKASYTFTPYFNGNVTYLVVGGGGGGGEGGGGAGGYLTGTLSITNGTAYAISVGAGGAGGTLGSNPGANGTSSTFASITAAGGGGGGSTTSGNGSAGGSGGGGRRDAGGTGGGGNTPVTTPSQGYSGGSSVTFPYVGAAGGGGAGGPGLGGGNTQAPSYPNYGEYGGAGGNGLTNSITGNSIYYAGGGGGCIEPANPTQIGFGGLGGGGNGGAGGFNTLPTPSVPVPPVPIPQNGINGLGGGGGGIAAATAYGYSAGTGGSGVVIIQFLS
jgi:hypothetical protein